MLPEQTLDAVGIIVRLKATMPVEIFHCRRERRHLQRPRERISLGIGQFPR
jgi:hypothetical protein